VGFFPPLSNVDSQVASFYWRINLHFQLSSITGMALYAEMLYHFRSLRY